MFLFRTFLIFDVLVSVHRKLWKAKARRKKSVTAVFYGGIKKLMKDLRKTEPYFARCINPNEDESPKIWTEDIVEHQLRCGGLLEVDTIKSIVGNDYDKTDSIITEDLSYAQIYDRIFATYDPINILGILDGMVNYIHIEL